MGRYDEKPLIQSRHIQVFGWLVIALIGCAANFWFGSTHFGGAVAGLFAGVLVAWFNELVGADRRSQTWLQKWLGRVAILALVIVTGFVILKDRQISDTLARSAVYALGYLAGYSIPSIVQNIWPVKGKKMKAES